LWVWGRFEGGFFTVPRHTTRPTPEPTIRSYRVEMPPKDDVFKLMMRNTAKMPRNPAEDALYRLTHAGDLFKEQVLARLDLTDRGMLRLANRDLRHAVDRSGLRWAFMVPVFVESIERFEWALKHKILESSYTPFRINNAIIEGGNLDVLKRAELAIRVYSPGYIFSNTEILIAATFGKTQIFEWFMDQPALHHDHFWPEPLRYAALRGHLDILKVFKARADKYPDDDVWHPKWDRVREATFCMGNVEIFECVLAHGTFEKDTRTFVQEYPIIELLSINGHLEMLQWLMARLEVENFPHIINHTKNNCMNTKRAAEYGYFEMLKWMVENGFKFPGDAITAAAKAGQLECIVYLRERGCNITPTVSKVTVNRAHIHVLRWAIENGGKWDPQWTLDQLEQIDHPYRTEVGFWHSRYITKGTVHENFGEDLQWVIQRAHQKINDVKLAAEEKQRRKDEKERREAKKRKAA